MFGHFGVHWFHVQNAGSHVRRAACNTQCPVNVYRIGTFSHLSRWVVHALFGFRSILELTNPLHSGIESRQANERTIIAATEKPYFVRNQNTDECKLLRRWALMRCTHCTRLSLCHTVNLAKRAYRDWHSSRCSVRVCVCFGICIWTTTSHNIHAQAHTHTKM